MDGFFTLLGVVTLLIALYAIGRVSTVVRRLDELRRELGDLQVRLADREPRPKPAVASPVMSEPTKAARPPGTAVQAENAGLGSSPAASANGAPALPAALAVASSTRLHPQVESLSLEERLGARAPVWLGSIALALAGAFLVKYTFDRGLLSPFVRVVLGLAFGVALLIVGEWMRRSNLRIAQGLSAAGIADLYACLLAATNLYHLVSPATGFLFIALNTAGAVALAFRQGAIVAAVGLIGGFLTPVFLGAEEPQPRTLFAYFLLLQCGLLAVSRRRSWSVVPLVSFAAGLFWVVGWLFGPFQDAHAIWLELFLLASITVTVGGAGRLGQADSGETGRVLRAVACIGGLVAMAMLLTSVAFATREWIFLGMLSAGILFLARLDVRSHGLIWVPPTALGLLLLKWLPALEQGDASRFLWTAGGFAALFVLGGYAGLFGARKPLAWAVVSGAFGPFALLVGHAGWKTLERAFPWGLTALVGATLYAILAWPLHRRRERLGDAPLAAMLVAASTLLSLAIPLELRREWLAVGWAIEVLGLVALAGRLKVAALRTMALVLVATVTARLLLNPHVLEYPIGRLPVFNWLLYGYGVPLAAFVGAAVLAERQGDAMLRRTLAWAALGFAFALLTLEVRHVFHRDHLGRGIAGFREWGVYIIGWLGLGLSLWRLAGRWPSLVHARAGTTVLSGALVFTAVGPGLLANPLLEHHWVGALPILNHIAWVLGVPVALFLWIWRAAARRGSNALARGSACAALLVSFLLVTLQVRQLFQGGFLDRGAASPAERYTYSAAWILFGTILLVLGIALRRKSMRLAALGVMLIAVLKVFLYDLAALRDLYRVFSFLGLGVSLLLLAWLYQRYVFRERPPSGETV